MDITRSTEKADASDSYTDDTQRQAGPTTDHAIAEGYHEPAHPAGPEIDGVRLRKRRRYPDRVLHACDGTTADAVALDPDTDCEFCDWTAEETAVGQWVVATVGTWHKIVAVDDAVGHTACGLTYGDDEVGETRRDEAPDAGACSGCLEAVANARAASLRAETDGGTDTVRVCPNCDSSRLQFRTEGHNGRAREGDAEYWCHDCQRTVDEPDERPRRRPDTITHGRGRDLLDADPEDLATDGGAIDNDFDEAERDAETILVENRVELADGAGAAHEQIRHPDVVIDLVTRQHMYVLRTAAASLPEYYEQEGFDLYNYKTHPFLPVRLDDTVYECVYLSDVDGLHRDADTYDFPAGRLAQATPRGEERSDGGEQA